MPSACMLLLPCCSGVASKATAAGEALPSPLPPSLLLPSLLPLLPPSPLLSYSSAGLWAMLLCTCHGCVGAAAGTRADSTLASSRAGILPSPTSGLNHGGCDSSSCLQGGTAADLFGGSIRAARRTAGKCELEPPCPARWCEKVSPNVPHQAPHRAAKLCRHPWSGADQPLQGREKTCTEVRVQQLGRLLAVELKLGVTPSQARDNHPTQHAANNPTR